MTADSAGKSKINIECRNGELIQKGVIPINIAFFLIPKKEVIYLPVNCTMRQAIEKMEFHRYTAVPLVDQNGRYVGTLTEGDLLWKMKNTPDLTFENTEKIPVAKIERRVENEPVRIDAKVHSLLDLAVTQNFVPVVDDEGVFIGIIRRREILEYFSKELLAKNGLL